MKEHTSELISALLDGELEGRPRDRALDGLLAGEPSDLALFGRYRLIGDVMRGENAVLADSVSAAVTEALRDEPAMLVRPARRRSWLKPVGGLAVAASVAAVAIVLSPQLPGPEQPALQPVAQTAALSQRPTARLVATATQRTETAVADSTAQWQALDEELADRLNRLVIEHHEFGGHTGINGPVAHIGFVSYGRR